MQPNRGRQSLPASILGAILVTVGSAVALWRAANLISVVPIAHDLPRGLMFQYFVANGFDVLWCALMAVSGYCIARRRENTVKWLIASSLAWIPGTAVYIYQASDSTGFFAKSLGLSVSGLMLAFLAFRVILLLPNLAAAAFVVRRGAMNADTSTTGPA